MGGSMSKFYLNTNTIKQAIEFAEASGFDTSALNRILEDYERYQKEEDADSRTEYYAHVGLIAKDIFQEAIDEAGKAKDDIEEWIHDHGYDRVHEDVDGSRWIIYTYLAKKVLDYSHNDNIGFDEGLIDTSTWRNGIEYEQVAFWAMRQDTQDALNDLLEEYEEPEDDDTDDDTDTDNTTEDNNEG